MIESSAAPPRRSPLLRLLGPAPLRARREDAPRQVVVRDGGQDQERRPRTGERDGLPRLVRRQGLRPERAHREAPLVGERESPRTSTPPRPLRTGASSWGTRTGGSTRSGPERGSALGQEHRGLRLLLGRRLGQDRLRRLLRRHFYALDAATGDVRWSFDAGGRDLGRAHRHSPVSSTSRPSRGGPSRSTPGPGESAGSSRRQVHAAWSRTRSGSTSTGYSRIYGLAPAR